VVLVLLLLWPGCWLAVPVVCWLLCWLLRMLPVPAQPLWLSEAPCSGSSSSSGLVRCRCYAVSKTQQSAYNRYSAHHSRRSTAAPPAYLKVNSSITHSAGAAWSRKSAHCRASRNFPITASHLQHATLHSNYSCRCYTAYIHFATHPASPHSTPPHRPHLKSCLRCCRRANSPLPCQRTTSCSR
jgi:hypothetical protein